MEEGVPLVNEGANADAAASNKKDNTKKDESGESKEVAVKNKDSGEQKEGCENGTKDKAVDGVKMAESEDGKEVDEDGAKDAAPEDVKMVDTEVAVNNEAEDVKMIDAKGTDKKEDKEVNKDSQHAKPAEGEDAKMDEVEAEAINAEFKDKEQKEGEEGKTAEKQKQDKEENTNVEKQGEDKAQLTGEEKQEMKYGEQTGSERQEELKEEGKGSVAEQEEKELVEKGAADKQEEEKMDGKGDAENEEEKANGKGAADKQEVEKEGKRVDSKMQEEEDKGKKKPNANKKKLGKDSAKKKEKDGEATEEQVSEADKNVEENKEETPKNKKARSVRERSQGKDRKQDGSKSREAKDLLSTPSPYALDRPVRERKTVERLVEVIEKEPSRNFVVEKGRGTPLKDISSVAHRISRKKPTDLKFLHHILFGRRGKVVDFKSHILQFSGFVWHESDEKQRAKAKEKLDKCVKDTLVDLSGVLAIPVPKTNSRKEDIVAKLLDFIAEPHAMDDSALFDDQGSNSRKRKRGGGSATKNLGGTPKRSRKRLLDEDAPSKRQTKDLASDADEEEVDEDEHMDSDSEENKDEDVDEEVDDEEEDDHDSGEDKASKKSSEGKGSAGKKKAVTGSGPKTAPVATVSKSQSKASSPRISKDKESPDDGAKVFSRKRKSITPKRASGSGKDIKEKKSSGKRVTNDRGKSAEAEKALPSMDKLRTTIVEILKKVDFNTATFSDILKKLMDMTPRKASIKLMIQEELTKLSEEADEDEDEKDLRRNNQSIKWRRLKPEKL